jgi:hypothetical protein
LGAAWNIRYRWSSNSVRSLYLAGAVLGTALVLWVFVIAEGRRLGMRHLWVYFVCTLTVGVSLALPLFLYLRAGRLQQEPV